MTGKEALKELYKEREYFWGEKVHHKSNENWSNDIKHYDNIGHNLIIIENDLERLEKLEEAIEIIVRKDICPTNLYSAIDYDKYKFAVEFDRIDKEWILTEEEFNLLKEVFNSGK